MTDSQEKKSGTPVMLSRKALMTFGAAGLLLIFTLLSKTGIALQKVSTLTTALQPKPEEMDPPLELDGSWTRKEMVFMRQYERLFADRKRPTDLGDPLRPESIKTWWQAAALIDSYINADLQYECKDYRKFGNWGACMDRPFTIKTPCLVYSFGIANDFRFDDAFAKFGCEVHSFDPSMGVKDHKRGPNLYFHNMGLGSFDSNEFVARLDVYVNHRQLWKMRTLKTVRKELGHSNRVIDVLKIDIEGHEWAVLENMIETGQLNSVRQFELEFHIFPKFPKREEYIKMYKNYRKLRTDLGFLEYSVGPHTSTLSKTKYNIQGDSMFVNSRFNNKTAFAKGGRR